MRWRGVFQDLSADCVTKGTHRRYLQGGSSILPFLVGFRLWRHVVFSAFFIFESALLAVLSFYSVLHELARRNQSFALQCKFINSPPNIYQVYIFILIGDGLLYSIVVVFAIHSHESAMGVHVVPILTLPQLYILRVNPYCTIFAPC